MSLTAAGIHKIQAICAQRTEKIMTDGLLKKKKRQILICAAPARFVTDTLSAWLFQRSCIFSHCAWADNKLP
jgi:hypothetical protein